MTDLLPTLAGALRDAFPGLRALVDDAFLVVHLDGLTVWLDADEAAALLPWAGAPRRDVVEMMGVLAQRFSHSTRRTT